jgi:hypothetical protein
MGRFVSLLAFASLFSLPAIPIFAQGTKGVDDALPNRLLKKILATV